MNVVSVGYCGLCVLKKYFIEQKMEQMKFVKKQQVRLWFSCIVLLFYKNINKYPYARLFSHCV